MRAPIARRRDTGQAIAEVALVAPLFFALFFGIVDIARVIWANDILANAAREGARFASVNAGTPTLTTQATKDQIRTRALDSVIAGGAGTTVTVCFSAVHVASQTAGCSGDVDEVGAGYGRGNLVTVRVQSQVPVFTGALLGFSHFTVSGESIVLINN
jgi:Flp pilus assembly protein TadG